jgi:hypothetical protein
MSDEGEEKLKRIRRFCCREMAASRSLAEWAIWAETILTIEILLCEWPVAA